MFKVVQPVAWDPVRLHDIWNLWVLGLLNALNLHYLATGAGFAPFWTAAQLYFLFDTVFVGIYPQSVRSPVVILSHHICAALYMLIPLHYPQYHWCMAACMTVEVNTWLLIARRVVGGAAVEALFYLSWFALRCAYYPYLIYAFYLEWRRETAASGTPWNPILATPIMQAFLTALNLKWTWELCSKLAAQRREAAAAAAGGKGGGGGKGASVTAEAAAAAAASKYDKHL